MAVAALVLGIVGLVCSFVPCLGMYAIPLTVLGVLFGALGLRSPRDGSPARGKGMAIAGLICGGIGTLIASYWIYIWVAHGDDIRKGIEEGVRREIEKQERKLDEDRERSQPAAPDPAAGSAEQPAENQDPAK